MSHRVVLIPGDATGPEITDATRRVPEKHGGKQAANAIIEKIGG